MTGKRVGAALLTAAATLSIQASVARAVQTTSPAASVAQTTQPAADANTPQAMEVRIVEVNGNVNVQTAPGQPWQAAAVDMVVGENASFRTGMRSSVTCIIPP